MSKLAPAGVVAVLVAVFATPVTAADREVIAGRRIEFSPSPPRWCYSGAWFGRELLLVDSLASEVYRYSTSGERLGELSERATSKPSIIHDLSSSALLLEDEDGYFARLEGSNFEVAFELNALEKATNENGRLVSVYDWIPMQATEQAAEVLLIGDILQGQLGYTAFVQLNLEHPAEYRVLHKLDMNDAAVGFYLLGQSYVASVNREPFFLVMAPRPFINNPAAGVRMNLRLVSGSQTRPLDRPVLPKDTGMDAARGLFETLERSTVPSGLYGWNGALYLLMRSPASRSGSRWWLTKFDPKANRMVWNREIDTEASHLTVIPGDEFWAFIEKGPVMGPGQQTILSALLAPAEQF
ncbi:MAG TPA: hypothetical protein VGC93_06820 [Thermoanaerobaculia bacterium]